MKKRMLLIFTLVLTLMLAACGNDDADEADDSEAENENTEQQQQEEVEITEDEKVEADTVVVSINGEDVTGEQYNNIYRQLKTMYQMYGQDVSDQDMLKDETIDVLTEQELIRQDALESGIEVTEDEVQEEIDNIIETNGEEAIDTMMEEYELSEEEFRNQMMNDLVTIRYIEEEFEAEVTDEEIEEQYNQLKEESEEEIGELEEYEEMIRQSLAQQKQNELLENRISELKETAEIEAHI